MLFLFLHQLPIEVVTFISEHEKFCLPLWKQTTTRSWRNNNTMFHRATFLPILWLGRYGTTFTRQDTSRINEEISKKKQRNSTSPRSLPSASAVYRRKHAGGLYSTSLPISLVSSLPRGKEERQKQQGNWYGVPTWNKTILTKKLVSGIMKIFSIPI